MSSAMNTLSMPRGLAVDEAKTETINTLGASFYLNPQVVFKVDYQTFAEDDSRNSLNLAMGVAF